jgi:transcriptional antiterminator
VLRATNQKTIDNELFRKKQKLKLLLTLIEKQNGGNASQLADKLCVSMPTIEKYLALLMGAGNNIGYCTRRKTYYFIDQKA